MGEKVVSTPRIIRANTDAASWDEALFVSLCAPTVQLPRLHLSLPFPRSGLAGCGVQAGNAGGDRTTPERTTGLFGSDAPMYDAAVSCVDLKGFQLHGLASRYAPSWGWHSIATVP